MKIGRGWIFPLAIVAIAEVAMRVSKIQSDILASPSSIAIDGIKALLDGSLLAATAQTLIAASWGLAVGATGGLLAGFLLGLSPTASRFCATSVEILRPIPSVALIPLMMLTFGFGYRMESSTVAFSTFWPFLIYTQHALREVDVRLIEVAKIMRFNTVFTIWKILLPAIMPRLFTALRLAVGIAIIVAVTVEIVANPQGLGYGLMVAQETLRPARMFSMLIWVGIMGWLINYGLLALQWRMFRHRSGHSGD